MIGYTSKGNQRTRKNGAVLVEFAVVLPVIMMFFAGMLEISRVLMLQHTADTAAYEGARYAMVPGATAEDAVQAAKQLLRAAGLQTATVTVTPQDIVEETALISVEVKIPVGPNSWITPSRFTADFTVFSEVTLFCERPPIIRLTGIPELHARAAKGGGRGRGKGV